jgi:hypothetical protein
MTDPQQARDRAQADGERAAEQLRSALDREGRVERVSWLSKRFLRDNHLQELLEQALTLGRRT